MKKLLLFLIMLFMCPLLIKGEAFKDGEKTYVASDVNITCSLNSDAEIADYIDDYLILVDYNENTTNIEEYYKYLNGTCSKLTTQETLKFRNNHDHMLYDIDSNYDVFKVTDQYYENVYLSASGTTYDSEKMYYTCGTHCYPVSVSDPANINNYYISMRVKAPKEAIIDSNETYYKVKERVSEYTLILEKVTTPKVEDMGYYYTKIEDAEDLTTPTKIGSINQEIFEPIFDDAAYYYIESNGKDIIVNVGNDDDEITCYDAKGNKIDAFEKTGKVIGHSSFIGSNLIKVDYLDENTYDYSHSSFRNLKYEELYINENIENIVYVAYNKAETSYLLVDYDHMSDTVKFYMLQVFKEKSNNFKALLDKDGNFVINSIPPKGDEDSWYIINEYIEMNYNRKDSSRYISANDCNEDYTECTITLSKSVDDLGETHFVPIKYNYDTNIKNIIANYLKAIPEDLEYFSVKDMELANYWVNGKDDIEQLVNYSGELKSYLGYKNFSIDLRQGDNGHFYTMASGIAGFKQNDILYGMRDNTGVEAKHIIYVPNDTESTKEALKVAVQKRFDDYFGKDVITVTAGEKTILDYEKDYYDGEIAKWQNLLTTERNKPLAEQNAMNIREYQDQIELWTDYKAYFMESYNETDGENYFLHDAEGDYYFIATVGESKYLFIVMKDSTKMVDLEVITTDINTDITISSTAPIPYDTIIQANKLISGDEYNKIIKILNVTDAEVFDLKLLSNSLDKYITKLDNGEFQVKIPISEKYKDKELMVYYISEGKVQTYEVKIVDNYAIFTTNHFSIYTLAEKATIKNPQTSDGIIKYILISSLSLISFGGIYLHTKKKKFN